MKPSRQDLKKLAERINRLKLGDEDNWVGTMLAEGATGVEGLGEPSQVHHSASPDDLPLLAARLLHLTALGMFAVRILKPGQRFDTLVLDEPSHGKVFLAHIGQKVQHEFGPWLQLANEAWKKNSKVMSAVNESAARLVRTQDDDAASCIINAYLRDEWPDLERILDAPSSLFNIVPTKVGSHLSSVLVKRAPTAFTTPVIEDCKASGIVRSRKVTLKLPPDTQLELQFDPGADEGEIESIIGQLYRHVDETALKVLVFVMNHGYRGGGTYWWNDGDACDAMGYEKDKQGRHRTKNKKRVDAAHRILAETKFHITENRIDPKTKKRQTIDTTLHLVQPLKDTSTIARTGRKPSRLQRYLIQPELYTEMQSKRFCLVPREALTLDTGRWPRAFALYSYVNAQWRMKWNPGPSTPKSQAVRDIGLVAFRLRTLVDRGLVQWDGDHKTRDLAAFHKTLDHLKQHGDDRPLLKEWAVRNPTKRDPLERVYTFAIPDHLEVELDQGIRRLPVAKRATA